MPVCVRCHQDTGIVGALRFNRQSGRCGPCDGIMQQALTRFRTAFLQFCADGLLAPQEWQMLVNGAQQEGIYWPEAVAFIRGDALNFLERTLAFAATDGIITDDEATYINQLQGAFCIPPDLAAPLTARLSYLQTISRVRQGKLPTIRPTVRLESDEICHLETAATYHKVSAKGTTPNHGRLIATNKKLHFLAPTGGISMDWKKIMRIEQNPGSIYLELSVKSGNGRYSVVDPLMTEAVLDTLVRMAKREFVAPQGDAQTRHIPQDVKQAVWQRDQGKCIQCGDSSYLEFDHIIPYSKGGANTVNNVQLLCRKCNLTKGDRI
jgi:hypothetical protein